MNSLERHRHPNFPAFWAHPKMGCHEVPARENTRTFARNRPELFGEGVEGAYLHGWISAVRWAGKEDFWLVQHDSLQRSVDLLETWAKYLLNRFPDEHEICVVTRPGDGYSAEGTITQFARGVFPYRNGRQTNLPGCPDAVSISVKTHFDEHCKKPTNRRRHPEFPGTWIHPKEGRVELNPGDHYSGFFHRHPEVFGSHLGHAYADGWVAIQRWSGYEEVWLVRYATLQPVLPTLRHWASDLVQRHPEEAATSLRSIPASEPQRIRGTLQDLAEGNHQVEEDDRCLLPPPEDLHQFCREARDRQEVTLSPWPDHVGPGDKKFVPLFPSNGDHGGYFNLSGIRKRIQDIEARLAKPGGVVGVMQRWGIRVTLHSLRSWAAQIKTGEVPECVGDGYLEWLTYLRCKNGFEPELKGRVL